MALKILLVISILLQITAAFAAIKLMRKTKFNSTWLLFTAALILMVVQQLAEFINSISVNELMLPKDFIAWVTVVIAFCFVLGLFYVRKIINYIMLGEKKRRLTEKRILNTIISTEEKERRRFSKDLHDGLGPLLSSVKMSVSALSKIEMAPASREIVDNADYVIEEAIKSLKEISNNLSPHILNNFGLARAISTFINKIGATNLRINFENNIRSVRFSSNIEVIIYRVVCELINNAMRHAAATTISVSINHSNELIEVVVEDNGHGFDTSIIDNRSESGGMGLSNIASRIASLKGETEITSSSKGTRVVITININE